MIKVEMKHIDKAYQQQKVLHEFHLEVQEQEFISLIGSSGCGKTTVMKMINGLLQPDHGTILVDGVDISKLDQNELRRSIGYVIQTIGLFPHMTIEENICYVLSLQKKDRAFQKARAKELMKLMELEEGMLKRYPDELSGGQKQRVGIARALAANPKLLLMDEPFGAVDEITRRSLQSQLKKLQQELQLTIIFVTHDIGEALRLSDRIMIMKDGKIEQFDTLDHILKEPATPFVKELLSYA